MPKRRKRVRRVRRATPEAIYRRFREMWSQGFGMLSGIQAADEASLSAVREAMRRLAADDGYWEALNQMAELSQQIQTLRKRIERSAA